jgi:hypothetical protein
MINNRSTNGIYIKEEYDDDARKRRTFIIEPIANNNNIIVEEYTNKYMINNVCSVSICLRM